MAEVVGVGRWKSFTKKGWALTPSQLAALQGLPPEWKWGDSRKESRLVCEATPPILANYIAGRIIVALRDGGDSLARGW
jgi:site-specific DNA-cytosine methylase